jgi:hypothetical protein
VRCPYMFILGWDTELPSPLYHSVVTGIDMIDRSRLIDRQSSTPI